MLTRLELGARAAAVALAAVVATARVDLRVEKALVIWLHGEGVTQAADRDAGRAAGTVLGGGDGFVALSAHACIKAP